MEAHEYSSAGYAADSSTQMKFQHPATILPNLLLAVALFFQERITVQEYAI